MKKLPVLLAALSIVAFTSCKKCADCTCTLTDTFTFEDGFPADEETSIRADYDQSTTYPDDTQEICEKGSNYDNAIKAYEAQTRSFQDDGSRQGKAWSYSGNYDCKCSK